MNAVNILTVDLEDWFHICGIEHTIPPSSWPRLESRIRRNTEKILDILAEEDVRATFFVVGYVAERHPDLITTIRKAGHEIACHGYAHQRIYEMTPDAFREDTRRAIRLLSAITQEPIVGYRAPEWSIREDSLWALDILCEEGVRYDASMAPVAVIGNQGYPRVPHRKELPGGTLWEFPPLVGKTPLVNLPLGGGWGLRIFPYGAIRSAIRKLNAGGQPAVIFLHPREFDLKNPRVRRLPLSLRFVLGARIVRTERRLRRLLADFRFTTVSSVLDRIDASASQEWPW
jgi:polysaccharide deacetylase family protein (PEP-CTERM system associated)